MRLTGRRAERRRGAALLVVLWLAVAAAGLALALLETTRAATPESRRALDAIHLRAALRAAVHATADRLLRERVELGPEGGRVALEADGIALAVRVVPESGLVDLGAASPGLLRALAVAAGLPAGRAAALAEQVERRRSGREEARGTAVGSPRGAAEDLRPPARPGLDHPLELLAGLGTDADAGTAAAIARWLAATTLGSGRAEPMAELAPPLVRAALAAEGPAASSPRPADAPAPDPRRADPANLYRLEIVATTAGGRTAVRAVRLAIRPGDGRPVRIVDWSAPLVLPDPSVRAEGS